MGGEHRGRDSGRDDDGYPSYHAPAREQEGFQERAWAPDGSWDRPSDSAWARPEAPAGAGPNSAPGDYAHDPAGGYGRGTGYEREGYERGTGHEREGYQSGTGHEREGYQSGTGYEREGYQSGTGYEREGYERGTGYEREGYENEGYQSGQRYESGSGYDSGSGDAGGSGFDTRAAATGQVSGYGSPPGAGDTAGHERTAVYEGWYDDERPGGQPYPPDGSDADAADRGREGRRRLSAGRGGGSRPASEGGRRRGLPLWQELPLLLVIAFCLAILVRTFLLQAFYIPSGSMEDTLLTGDRVLVNKVVYDFREPARGEIVVFRAESWSAQPIVDDDVGALARIGRTLGDLVGISRPGEKDYIKRIIGLPGDRVSCCDVDGRVFLNGQPLDEAYVLYNAALGDPPEGVQDCRNRRFDEVVVEPGHMFVMGDHRAVSQDSRCQGQVLIDDIIGRADVIMWPSDRWGRLRAPEFFESVPAPIAGGSTTRSPWELVLALPMLVSLTMVRAARPRSDGLLAFVDR